MSFVIKKILWPTDFSDLSLHSCRAALELARGNKAELHIIHIVTPPLSPELSVMIPAEAPLAVLDEEVLTSARASIDKLVAERGMSDLTVVRDAFYGNPWSAICTYAHQQSIDLIAISTHGRTGISHVLIGSTAERVVQHAHCPVLTVKDPNRPFSLA